MGTRRVDALLGRGARCTVAIVALMGGLLTTASSASAQEDPPPGILPEGDWSPDQEDYMLDLVERTEQALPAFSDDGVRDEELLEQLGFVNFGLTAPGGWDHWMNKEWLDDDHILDPEHPESLVHRWDGEKWVLEAAMFFLRSDDTIEDIPEKYADIAWLPGWHAHPELCWDETLQTSGCADGEQILVPMMHVWIADNPCGHRFAGVGVGGINCGEHGHEHPPELPQDPSEICDDPELLKQLGIEPEGLCDDRHDNDHDHGDDPGDDTGQGRGPGAAPPAPAITGRPGFTG